MNQLITFLLLLLAAFSRADPIHIYALCKGDCHSDISSQL